MAGGKMGRRTEKTFSALPSGLPYHGWAGPLTSVAIIQLSREDQDSGETPLPHWPKILL
jgi:hypothetical protein